jgi:hypothetical protein
LANKADTTYVDSQIGAINVSTVSTTAPSSPAAGDMWFDTTAGTTAMKVWSGIAWDQMSNKFSATGGTVTTYGNYKVHTFTSSGTFTTEGSGSVDILMVGGGGSGGAGTGGGGGAGGLIYKTSVPLSASSFSVVIGSGGTNDSADVGTNGNNTTFNGLVALGGGWGASTENNPAVGSVYPANSGGSGGGDANYYPGASTPGGATQPGSASGGFGNSGGNGAGSYSGGGGGAGASGSGSNGGSGKQYSIRTGSNSWYAAGGSGGESGATSTNGIGGYHSSPNGTNGVANTGSGGGGGWSHSSGDGGNGGSGIVIVRYTV